VTSVPERLRITLGGAVQGVGFRPFVYRLAQELGLAGFVQNSDGGLIAEVEGPQDRVERFLERLEVERPAASRVFSRKTVRVAPLCDPGFHILQSQTGEDRTASVLPDLAMCRECLSEMLDPANRRFGYPFTNCTHCGPRYTIVEDIPYDRPNTTMQNFPLCPECRREYENPSDRRFHAQPNACPVCGPTLIATAEAAIGSMAGGGVVRAAAEALGSGRIVALKGIGGFQLLVDARNFDAVARLRERKHREHKPLAVMVPDLIAAREIAVINPEEAKALESAAAPIVLLRPVRQSEIAGNVAAHSGWIGIMLPYSPVHHLLMREVRFPVVATSGNRSDEPIAIRNEEAFERLRGIADLFLMHDRPIARPCDDSVVRGHSILRRARGYAPLAIPVGVDLPPVLAVGGHLKNTVAIGVGRQVFLSQHIGDLETEEARDAFERAVDDLCRLYRFKPEVVACDLHPDYYSTRFALGLGLPVLRFQHHHSHVGSCLGENRVEGPILGIAWDGTGYGLDGAIWGSEFFVGRDGEFERIAHLRPFRLAGGEVAAREGWRVAVAMRRESGLAGGGPATLTKMLERHVNSPLSTSMGRLFDAVAAMSGVAQENHCEGEAAMMLERAIQPNLNEAYPLPGGDWREMIRAVASDARNGVAGGVISARFHNALVKWICEVADTASVHQVLLSGGVFQNHYLTERSRQALESRGHRVYAHCAVPPNDGGIALGQAVLAAAGAGARSMTNQ
jgi:hydrogenase maturation protein HypF